MEDGYSFQDNAIKISSDEEFSDIDDGQPDVSLSPNDELDLPLFDSDTLDSPGIYCTSIFLGRLCYST